MKNRLLTLIAMKLAILAFLAPDARSGETFDTSMRPYDQVLADFKSRVAANDCPISAREKGLVHMQIWTRNGVAKKHRFNLPAPAPAAQEEPAGPDTSAYDGWKKYELNDEIDRRNVGRAEDDQIQPAGKTKACLAEALAVDDERQAADDGAGEPTGETDISDTGSETPYTESGASEPSPQDAASQSADTGATDGGGGPSAPVDGGEGPPLVAGADTGPSPVAGADSGSGLLDADDAPAAPDDDSNGDDDGGTPV